MRRSMAKDKSEFHCACCSPPVAIRDARLPRIPTFKTEQRERDVELR